MGVHFFKENNYLLLIQGFSFFHTPIGISRNSLDLDEKNWRMLVSEQSLQVCQISEESEGVREKNAKNLMI